MANNKIVTVDILQYNNEKIKEQLDKKVNIQQDVADANKVLGIDATGLVTPIELPDSVKISQDADNQIEERADGIYVKDMSVKISAELDNALIQKDDGLFVPTTAETKVSQEEGNTIEIKDDGIYVAPTDLSEYVKTEEVNELIENELYIDKIIPGHYELADSTTDDALEVVADGTATDEQIDISNVDGLEVQIGDYVIFIDETTVTESKFAEKNQVYSKDEVDAKIIEASTGMETYQESEWDSFFNSLVVEGGGN